MIRLAPLESSDSELVNKLYNNERIQYEAILGYSLPENNFRSQRRLEDWLSADINKEKHYKILSDRNAIGIAQIFNVNFINSKCNIGILIEDKEQSKGVGKKVLSLLAEICFKHMNLNKIEVEILEHNVKSLNLMKNFGFKEEGVLEKSIFKNGEFKDLHLYGYINENRV